MDREALAAMQARFEDRTYLKTGVFDRPTMADMAGLIRALLATPAPEQAAPPADIAAAITEERFAQQEAAPPAAEKECGRCNGDGFEPSTHSRASCSLCGGKGQLPAAPPAVVEAVPGVGEAFTRWVAQWPGLRKFPAVTAFTEGWNAALATACPAGRAVTAEMVEAACRQRHSPESWLFKVENDPERVDAIRKEVQGMLTAALSARQEGGA